MLMETMSVYNSVLSDSEWRLLLHGEVQAQRVDFLLHFRFADAAHVGRLLADAFGFCYLELALQTLDGLHLGLACVAVGDVNHEHRHDAEYSEPVTPEEVHRKHSSMQCLEHQRAAQASRSGSCILGVIRLIPVGIWRVPGGLSCRFIGIAVATVGCHFL